MKIYFLILIVLFGCSQNEKKHVDDKVFTESFMKERPKFDLTTPDQTIRSLLNYQTWVDTSSGKLLKEYNAEVNFNNYEPFSKSIADTLRARAQRENKFTAKRYTIENVHHETSTRAIVTIKTPDSTYGLYNEKTSISIKYALMKNQNNWLIESGKRICFTCDGLGKVRDYSNYYNDKARKKCSECGGEGWEDIYK